MRNQATWGDLAKLHNMIVDARQHARRMQDSGCTLWESDRLERTQEELSSALISVRLMVERHPASVKQREKRELAIADAFTPPDPFSRKV